jgi:dipeptidase E
MLRRRKDPTMFDRFTDHAKQSLSHARQAALELSHDYIGAEHMLLGLLRLQASVSSRMFEILGVDVPQLRQELLAKVRPGTKFVTAVQLPFTPGAKQVLEESLAVAGEMSHNYIGSEHLLLAMTRLPATLPAQLLAEHGVTTDRTQHELIAFLGAAEDDAGASGGASVRALLISNSTMHGGGYLEHCAAEIHDFLGPRRRVMFVPYALADHDGYAKKAATAFAALGHDLVSVHTFADPALAVLEADAVFVGGGNTFRLLKAMLDRGIHRALRDRTTTGMPYIGSSAGTNVATLSIRTTNDMPIVQPSSFGGLRLVPFQINPHYLDADPGSTHMGETREERIRQFHEESVVPVLGLREGCMVRVEGRAAVLKGTTKARLFRRGEVPVELTPVCDVSFLMEEAGRSV